MVKKDRRQNNVTVISSQQSNIDMESMQADIFLGKQWGNRGIIIYVRRSLEKECVRDNDFGTKSTTCGMFDLVVISLGNFSTMSWAIVSTKWVIMRGDATQCSKLLKNRHGYQEKWWQCEHEESTWLSARRWGHTGLGIERWARHRRRNNTMTDTCLIDYFVELTQED